MNEISIPKDGCLRISLAKVGGVGSKSHIGRKTKLKWVYKLECIIGLQASMHGFTTTPTRAQGGCESWIS